MSVDNFEVGAGLDPLELAEIHEVADADLGESETDTNLTPGECMMARDMDEAGDTREEIAGMFSVDERQLAVHLDGYCDCPQRGERR